MNTNALLDLLEKDARLTVTDLADMLEEEEDTVRAEVKRLENDKIICGYHTVINYNRGSRTRKSWHSSKWTAGPPGTGAMTRLPA